ncbi:MAG: hypothetical protein JW941_07115, partial [Candidatus Coatesbacteria bacterium]|nr:hypothetical protein [Candidatus Coatesbacteria bacterium]
MAFAIFLPLRATILNDIVMNRGSTLKETQEWFLKNGEKVAPHDYSVASMHSLWTPRTIGGHNVSIGEIFIGHLSDGGELPDASWFIEQGVVFFTLEDWGISRYSGFDWPTRMHRLIRRHCILLDTFRGWPPDPRWFPDHGFAAPTSSPRALFGPTIQIYMLQPHLLPRNSDG